MDLQECIIETLPGEIKKINSEDHFSYLPLLFLVSVSLFISYLFLQFYVDFLKYLGQWFW